MPTLDWIGKDKVLNHHQEVPYRILKKKYSFPENSSFQEENMIIHGDNLEALKALLPKYSGEINCIYIDPPYNTAKSSSKNKNWVYSDNVDHPKIKKWLGSLVGDEGEDLSRDDKWLCMMYPRLKLLQKLLSKDGIIFISIDDNENHYLRIICDEIFGKRNFIAQLIWKSDGNFDNQAKIKVNHEYVLCYSKNIELLGLPSAIDPGASKNSKIFNSEIRNTIVKNGFKNPMSEVILPEGFPASIKETVIKARDDVFPYYDQDAIIKDYKLVNSVRVKSGWSSKNIFEKFIENNFNPVLDTKGQNTIFEITSTGAIESMKKRENASHVLSVINGLGSTQNMSNELKKISISFDFPKPVDLIEYLLSFYDKKDAIVLDSFAGSGTVGHAVLNMNKKDNGNRKFILIEMEDYADSLTAQRVKKVITGYGEGKAEKIGTAGDFTFFELGLPLFLSDGNLNRNIPTNVIKEYIWFMETKLSLPKYTQQDDLYYLGMSNSVSYYFYYDRDSVTTLNYDFLKEITVQSEGYVIYADICTLSEKELFSYNIIFKKIPRDIEKL